MNTLLSLVASLFLFSCIEIEHGKVVYTYSEPDELTKEQVQKDYCEKKGLEYPKMKKWVCVRIPSDFVHVAAIGSFAYDRGCKGETYLFDGDYQSLKKLTPKALNYYGWKDENKREKLALEWTKTIVFAWVSVVSTKPDEFEEREFSIPKVESKQGTVTVELWLRKPAGKMNVRHYFKAQVKFSEIGELLGIERIATESISG